MTYCIVPRDLAAKLHEPLRKHFLANPDVEVVVEQRTDDRRQIERRADREAPPQSADATADRRRVRGESGRRAGERRMPFAGVAPLPLPRRARPHADRLLFIERLEPSVQHLEDVDTDRLVVRFQSGQPDAFSELYIRYFDRVYSYLLVAFRDQHEAEDAAQQVFMKVLEALPRYRRTGKPFRAWLFTIVRRYAITELEKRSRITLVDQPAVAGDEPAIEEDRLDVLNWISDRELLLFFERLPLAQRQVLMLRFGLDLTHREVAEVMDRSNEQVRNLQSRGLAFMRARLRAVGRESTRSRQGIRRCPRQAPVLRMRRFALHRW